MKHKHEGNENMFFDIEKRDGKNKNKRRKGSRRKGVKLQRSLTTHTIKE